MSVLKKKLKEGIEDANKTRKKTEQMKKMCKKKEHERNLLKNTIREKEIHISKIKKEQSEAVTRTQKFEVLKLGVIEEMKMMTAKSRVLSMQESEKKAKLEEKNNQIRENKEKIKNLQAIEMQQITNIKNLTTTRETMARKSSIALAEVRETRQQLKIKELLILDLTKKQQEIEFELNRYKSLYEEVKTARNKYVNMIQNSSQELAELKEKIKIYQNELEILKNESSEKERTLNKLNQTIQSIVHERDKARTELNKREYKKKGLNEQLNQQSNQISKLNMITMSLQNDMLEIREHYESACESRNIMGVQLIDRNDEL